MRLKISEGKKGKKRRSKGRPKNFEGESKVISFRVDKEIYEKKKDEIREKINNVIEIEVKNKGKPDKVESIKKEVKKESENFRKEIIKPDYINRKEIIKERYNKPKQDKTNNIRVETEDRKEDLIEYYCFFRKKNNE